MNNNKLDILKKRGSGFKTPENYFKTVEDTVVMKLAMDKFPEDEPGLDVPKGYFDSIEEKVFRKIQHEATQEPKIINLPSKWFKVVVPIAIAASLLLILVLNYTGETYSIENVAASDIEEWIEEDLILLDSYEIAELYDDISLENEFSIDDLNVLDYVNGTDIESILLTD